MVVITITVIAATATAWPTTPNCCCVQPRHWCHPVSEYLFSWLDSPAQLLDNLADLTSLPGPRRSTRYSVLLALLVWRLVHLVVYAMYP